ncbi:MAG: group 1 glycosyl transferase, partial [Arenibacter sp.]|nr:group 1 glycosyl transferase [Arenibacter sp.]
NPDASNIAQLAEALEDMLSKPKERDKWGFNGQIRVIEKFTLFSQIRSWLATLAKVR